MNLSKLENGQKLYLCKWYFRVGWLFLPFMWFVNATWFFKEAFKKEPYDEQVEIRRYVILSFCGAAVWLVGLITWVVIFQTHRVEWGELGDQLSVVYPTGRA